MPLAPIIGATAQAYSLGVSLVLYRNEPAVVGAVLASLRDTPCNMSICVVDNSPTQELRPIVDAAGARYIHDPTNPGFGASHNRAIQDLPSTDFHLVVNPDVSFSPDAVPRLINVLREEKDLGLVSPRILHPNGELQHLCKRYPSVLVLFARRFVPRHLQFLLKRRMDRFEMRDVGYDKPMDVEYASGCFMLFRRGALARVNGFDPKFFLYLEDADISLRVAEEGFKVRYCPDSHVIHHWARGSHKSWRLTWASIRSSLYFFSKHGWKWV